MAENTDFNELNTNLTGYSDTDDDNDNDDNVDVDVATLENVENTDQPDVEAVEVDEENTNIQPGNEDENISDFQSNFENCDDDGDDENDQVMQGFFKQLLHLQEQIEKKKKENRLIPCVSNFMKLDFDERSQQISPTITRHLLHVCGLIVRNKLDIQIDHGDRVVLEHITGKDCPKKDIKFTLVEDLRILGYIRKAVRQLELIKKTHTKENGQRSQAEVKKSVRDKSSTAGNDIINYLRKTDSYRKSIGLDQAVDDDTVAPENNPVPVTAGASGAGHKPGTVAASAAKIEQHFQKHNVKPTAQGIRYGSNDLNISYQDMLEDLTRNYVQTQPNLNDHSRRRVLLLLKKTNMPISYIRNKTIKEQYKQMLSQSGQASKPGPSAIPTPIAKSKGKQRKARGYLSD
ncbi:Hypothetical predicted protein [Paramuricea clavata]|uniref:Uncharacterized protein n=1 Tax=Paramuricea clavata TaxID=317549 RepID=A0A6S7G5J8_PARCT|nr:Hypothetical predicted protein [Paramuricea clavata]